jgi:hypothetical protein
VLTEEALDHRKILSEFGVDAATQILLGATWVQGWMERILRYSKLFVDSIHGTNNESRPLLQLVGRDGNSKAYTICQICMPNETATFYIWVFMEALPFLLGKENLCRVKPILSDGNSQEFNAIDEEVFQVFKYTTWLLCISYCSKDLGN